MRRFIAYTIFLIVAFSYLSGCAALRPAKEIGIVQKEYMVKTPAGLEIYVVGKKLAKGAPKGWYC